MLNDKYFSIDFTGKCGEYATTAFHYTSILFGPILTCVSASLICLVPLPNVMEHPEYWFEEMFLRFLAETPLLMSLFLVHSIYWSGFWFNKKLVIFAFVIGKGSCTCLIYWIVYHVIWTYALGFPPPVPFGIYAPGSLAILTVIIGFWFGVPKVLRRQQSFKKRYLWFCILLVTVISISFCYSIFASVFASIDEDYQWILALLSPLALYISNKIAYNIAKMSVKVEERDNSSLKLICQHYMTTRHTVFLAIIFGGVATPASSYCILATDYAKVLFMGLRIIYNFKKGNTQNIKGIISS